MDVAFEYTSVPALPRLAWLARRVVGGNTVTVVHGLGVEVFPTFYFEGAWRGEFSAGRFHESHVVLGSGGRAEADGSGVIFSTPSHSLERLQSIRMQDEFIISNSLPLLMGYSGESLDQSYPYHDIDLLSFVEGIPGAAGVLPLSGDAQLKLHYCSDVVVDRQLRVVERGKTPFATQPGTYAAYLDFLLTMTSDVVSNAQATERSTVYQPLGTLSTGYDSPACAVLARSVGCSEAVTFRTARANFSDSDDSGTAIGERLGFEVREYERHEYLDRGGNPEVEFLAPGTGGEDVVMAALDSILPGRLLFTGFLGDTVWGLRGSPSNARRYRITYPAGSSLTEFRLRVGFVHFPIPQVHHRLHPAVLAISQSPEMEPWRVGGDYDRPIPRRIAEDAGLPRDSFGLKKKAITQPFYQGDRLSTVMSPGSYESLKAYRNAHRRIGKIRRALAKVIQPVTRLAGRLSWRLKGRRRPVWKILRWIDPESDTMAFQWALKKMKERYRSALESVERVRSQTFD